MSLEEAVAKLTDQFQIVQRTDFRDETTLELTLAQIEPACLFAKEKLGFNFLTDLSSVDNFGDEPRFEVVYELYSLDTNILRSHPSPLSGLPPIGTSEKFTT
jgi:NADH-quinone oxidoreductase subunit C